MKRSLLLLSICLLLLLNSSCLIVDVADGLDETISGSGHIITESRALPQFNSVIMNMAGKVYLVYGDEQEVTVTVDQNIAEYIITSVQNGKLVIETARGVSLSNYKLIINLTMTDLEELVTNSSGDIIGKNLFYADVVNLTINSSGDISLDLEANQLYSRISSSGDLFLSGSVPIHQATISSSGDLHAFNLVTDTTKITLNSSGNAEVYVSRLLDIRINSSGDLFFKGHPTIYKSISSSGRIYDSN
jgi:hypothetical protein